MRRKRVSVTSQVVLEPLILSSMSRHNKTLSADGPVDDGNSSVGSSKSNRFSDHLRSKRDSLVDRISIKRSSRGAPEQPSDSMAPVYRLYPHQTQTGKRELRAMENTATDSTSSTDRGHALSSSIDTAIFSPPPPLPTSKPHIPPQPVAQDFQERYRSRSPLPNYSVPLASPSAQHSSLPTSPDFLDMDDGWDSRRPHAIQVPDRASSRQATTRHAEHYQPAPLTTSFSAMDNSSSPASPVPTIDHGYRTGNRSSGDSVYSHETSATSVHTLPALQTKGPDNGDAQTLEPLLEDDPRSFDLVEPPQETNNVGMYLLEKRAELMMSNAHLRAIFDDPKLLLKFTGFLNSHRPNSLPVLIYYLDALKAIRAIRYANAIAEALEPIRGFDFTSQLAKPTHNTELEEKAELAFDLLVREDLPAYVAYTWIQVVSVSIQRRITGTLAPHLREASEGLAEVFCLSDPSRPDNPIVFASEEFARTTQYGMTYAIGRNCRFLQGPRTSPHSVRRLAETVKAGKEHSEVFVNYRRDGSPFVNLLMTAPLMDSKGVVRYFIGAQVDVSGLLKSCSELEGLARLVERDEAEGPTGGSKDEFQELTQMFNGAELETVRKHGGRMHKEYDENSDSESVSEHRRPRLRITDPSQEVIDRLQESVPSSVPPAIKDKMNGQLAGVYQHYLLIRPYPSLRILFTSPSLRVPGILQSPFLHRIGGSSRVRNDLSAALAEGRGVTAKVRWLTRADEDGEGEGRPRWLHCTPLLGHSGAVGVWMVVIVDDEASAPPPRKFRTAPPVATNIGGKEWDGRAVGNRQEKKSNMYDVQSQRRGDAAAGLGRDGDRGAGRGRDTGADNRSIGSSRSGRLDHSVGSDFSFGLR